MTAMSISEALAEIKLIDKKISKKRETIVNHSTRMEHLPDPFPLEQGGSPGYIRRELQAISDLLTRRIRIRALISEANLVNIATVEHVTQNICSWLVWKREVVQPQIKALQELQSTVARKLAEMTARPQLYKKEDGSDSILVKVISNVDIAETVKGLEHLITIQEKLDGVLSMKNAQINIDI